MAVVVSGSFSPSPSARACSDLKADVASYVNAPNSARALAKAEDFIGSAVAKLNTRQWPWSILYQDVTLVADTADYDLSERFNFPRTAELLDSSNNALSLLGYEDPKIFSAIYSDRSGAGSPCAYTVTNPHSYGQVRLNIAPNSAYVAQYPTLRLWYYAKVVPCGGSTTTLDVPFEVAEWVSWYAKSLMASHFDPGKASNASAIARDLWSDLLSQKANVSVAGWD